MSAFFGMGRRLAGFLFGPDDARDRAEALERRAMRGEDTSPDAAIDLKHYTRVIRAHLRPIAICAATTIVMAILYLHTATYRYTVTMEVTPVDNGRESSLTSGVAGLASLAGINLPENPAQAQLDLYLAAINSSEVAWDMLQKPGLTHMLFASSWDEDRQQWREPSSLTRPLKNTIRGALGYPASVWEAPSVKDMMDTIEQRVLVTHKPESPIVTIIIKDRDPAFCRNFLLALHTATDNRLRNRVLQRTSQYITYLTRELQTVTSADHREALINTLSSEEARRMAASASMSYSVDVFSPPTASTHPTDPRPTVVLAAALLVGLLLGVGLVLGRYR